MDKQHVTSTVIITGANGFIGSHLTNFLTQNKIKVYAVIRSKTSDISLLKKNNYLSIVYCDINNIAALPELIPNQYYDAIIHLAWNGSAGKIRADYHMQLKNVEHTCNLIYTLQKIKCKRFLCMGTVSEHLTEQIFNISLPPPNLTYASAKQCSHFLTDIICKLLNQNYIWMQCGNVYGSNNFSGNLISYTVSELGKGNKTFYSSGKQILDFVYIDDVIMAIYLLIFSATTKNFYYIGSGKSKPLKDFLHEIARIYDMEDAIILNKHPDDGLEYKQEWYNISDLIKDTGFQPKYDFSQGIERTIRGTK